MAELPVLNWISSSLSGCVENIPRSHDPPTFLVVFEWRGVLRQSVNLLSHLLVHMCGGS